MHRYIFFRTSDPQALIGKGLVSLLSPSAFTFAADLFAQYEGSGDGLGWGDLWSDSFPLGLILIMLTIDIKIYATLGWCALHSCNLRLAMPLLHCDPFSLSCRHF